jgi:uncharacterized protein DUF4347
MTSTESRGLMHRSADDESRGLSGNARFGDITDSAIEPLPTDAIWLAGKDSPKKKPTGQFLVIIATGYPGYKTPVEEIEAAENKRWFPHTDDFKATADGTLGKVYMGASRADEFFGAFQGVRGKIARVAFIGHGHSSGLGLGGDIVNLDFFGETLTSSDLSRWQQSIDQTIKLKLEKDATIDLYACNVALGQQFMKDVAKAFDVCVRGFAEPIKWCLGYDIDKITSRGRLAPGSAVKDARDCSNGMWHKGVHTLVPPVKVCP